MSNGGDEMLILPRQNGKTDPLVRHLKAIEAENAKLREFASELLAGVCDVCAFPPCEECEVYATARELGIEVKRWSTTTTASTMS